jgi:DnaK suppressor protein
MPRKDTLLRLRQRLILQRDALRRKLAADAGWTQDDIGHGDVADVAYLDHEQEMHTQLAALESRELDRLTRAIQAIDEGRYGTCEVCGGKIALARLQAIPDATCCINCQQSSERRHGNRLGRANWESAWEYQAREQDRELTVEDVVMD